MRNQLEKALNIAKRTGDRLIVFESAASENPFVVMNMDEYEKLLFERSEVQDLTEEELLDKINRDIALWKSTQEVDDFSIKVPENQVILEEKESESTPERAVDQETEKKNRWAIKSEIKEAAEEIIEEDRHYLEEVQF